MDQYFWLLPVLVISNGLAIAAYRTYVRYKAADGPTAYDRFWAVFRQSGTILWARFLAFGSVISLLLANTADWFNASPQIQDSIRAMLDPKYVPLYTFVIAVVTEYIRRRNAKLPPAPEPK